MTSAYTLNKARAAKWEAEAAECEAAAKRYAARGMDEEVTYFTAKAIDCRELAESYRQTAPLQQAAE